MSTPIGQRDFDRLANVILGTLASSAADVELTLLAMAAAEFLASVDSRHRRAARNELIAAIDEMTRERAIARRDV
jgi:hypothetical protein